MSKYGNFAPEPQVLKILELFYFTQMSLTIIFPASPQPPLKVVANSGYGKLSVLW